MSTDDPLKNWQLEGQGESPQQWKLQDTEQDLNKHLQLQPGEIGPQWQPVEYQRGGRSSRRNWVLPSIVIVALLAVLGYVGWIFLGQGGGGGSAISQLGIEKFIPGLGGLLSATSPTETTGAALTESATEVAVATEVPPTPTVEPTALPAVVAPTTEIAAVPTPEAAPTLGLADWVTGTVNVVTGVNARKEPATTADVVTLLNQNELLTVVKNDNGWLQVILPDGVTVAWVSAEFVDQVTQQVPLEELNALLTKAGLPPAVAAPAASLVAVTSTVPAGPPVSLVVTVTGDPSITARELPNADSKVVRTVDLSTTLTAIGRTADDAWIDVQLPEGTEAWLAAEFVSVAGDIKQLAILDSSTPAPSSAVTNTNTATGPTANLQTALQLAINGVVPLVPFTNTLPAVGPALTVSDTTGVNARVGPARDAALIIIVPDGAVLPVIGRSTAGDWYQVTLPDGAIGWMFADAVIASFDAVNAPVTDGGTAATTPAVATPTGAAPATPAVTVPAGPTAVATVTNELGANLRTAPTRDLDPVRTVNRGETFTAIGRTADGAWVQLVMTDGTNLWAIVGTVGLDADINTLTVTQP